MEQDLMGLRQRNKLFECEYGAKFIFHRALPHNGKYVRLRDGHRFTRQLRRGQSERIADRQCLERLFGCRRRRPVEKVSLRFHGISCLGSRGGSGGLCHVTGPGRTGRGPPRRPGGGAGESNEDGVTLRATQTQRVQRGTAECSGIAALSPVASWNTRFASRGASSDGAPSAIAAASSSSSWSDGGVVGASSRTADGAGHDLDTPMSATTHPAISHLIRKAIRIVSF